MHKANTLHKGSNLEGGNPQYCRARGSKYLQIKFYFTDRYQNEGFDTFLLQLLCNGFTPMGDEKD